MNFVHFYLLLEYNKVIYHVSDEFFLILSPTPTSPNKLYIICSNNSLFGGKWADDKLGLIFASIK